MMTTPIGDPAYDKAIADARLAIAEADRAEIKLGREAARERIEAASNHRRRAFHLVGPIGDVNMFQTMRLLEQFARMEPPAPVEMLITSPGGSVVHGMAIVDRVASLRAQGAEINTFGLGLAGSIAGVILQSGQQRALGPKAWLLIHEVSLEGFSGTTSDAELTTAWLKKVHEQIVDLYMERARGISRKRFVANWKRKDWFIDAHDAVKLGLADEVR